MNPFWRIRAGPTAARGIRQTHHFGACLAKSLVQPLRRPAGVEPAVNPQVPTVGERTLRMIHREGISKKGKLRKQEILRCDLGGRHVGDAG